MTGYKSALLLAGSYKDCSHGGLRAYRLDTGSLEYKHLYDIPVGNASFMAAAESGVVYALTESDSENSFLTAFRAGYEGYRIINRVKVGADSPCYAAITPDSRFVVIAGYGDGSASAFPIIGEGGIGECSWRVRFKGRCPYPGRQDCSRLHCVCFTPDRKFMLVSDLGNDSIYGFRLLGNYSGPASEEVEISLKLAAGSGPRHIVFDKTGHYAFVINEISDCVTVLRYDGKSLSPIQYITANKEEAHGAGDICLSRDNRYLFASLRLRNDGVAAFIINPDDGTLQYAGHTPTGLHPRNMNLTGDRLFVSCKDTGTIEIYSEHDGTLVLDKGISQPMAVFSMLIHPKP